MTYHHPEHYTKLDTFTKIVGDKVILSSQDHGDTSICVMIQDDKDAAKNAAWRLAMIWNAFLYVPNDAISSVFVGNRQEARRALEHLKGCIDEILEPFAGDVSE